MPRAFPKEHDEDDEDTSLTSPRADRTRPGRHDPELVDASNDLSDLASRDREIPVRGVRAQERDGRHDSTQEKAGGKGSRSTDSAKKAFLQISRSRYADLLQFIEKYTNVLEKIPANGLMQQAQEYLAARDRDMAFRCLHHALILKKWMEDGAEECRVLCGRLNDSSEYRKLVDSGLEKHLTALEMRMATQRGVGQATDSRHSAPGPLQRQHGTRPEVSHPLSAGQVHPLASKDTSRYVIFVDGLSAEQVYRLARKHLPQEAKIHGIDILNGRRALIFSSAKEPPPECMRQIMLETAKAGTNRHIQERSTSSGRQSSSEAPLPTSPDDVVAALPRLSNPTGQSHSQTGEVPANDAPDRRSDTRTQRVTQASSSRASQLEQQVEYSPALRALRDLSLAGDKKKWQTKTAILDTGAEANFISLPFYESLSVAAPMEANDIQLETAVATKMKLVGRCQLSVRYGPSDPASWSFCVVNGLAKPLIIGCADSLPFIKANDFQQEEVNGPAIRCNVISINDSMVKETNNSKQPSKPKSEPKPEPKPKPAPWSETPNARHRV